MIVRIITVRVREGNESTFESATAANHVASMQEPGVLRFDVLKDNNVPGTYYLYEAYRDEAATVAHKETQHYHDWKQIVSGLLAGERTSVSCSVVEPRDESNW